MSKQSGDNTMLRREYKVLAERLFSAPFISASVCSDVDSRTN